MFKIMVLNKISEQGLSQLPSNLYKISDNFTEPNAILVRSADMHQLKIPESVLMVGRAGVGVNNIPVAYLTDRGVPVFNTPSANSNAVRELVIAAMLLASRNICSAWNFINELNLSDEDLTREVEQSKSRFVGTELAGKTLGVIGLGNVGVKVANAAIALGMRVIGYDTFMNVERAWELSANVEKAASLDSLYAQADYLTIHVTLSKETAGFINHQALNSMKKGVVILNFSRTEIVDNSALNDALHKEKIGFYVSDFPTVALKNHPRVIFLPHLGASTKEAEENCAIMIVRQMRQFLETGSLCNSVNFPSLITPLPPGQNRIVIVNRNIPNMVAQITAKFGGAGVNINHLANVSRETIAYTLVDINADIENGLIDEIAAINGVLNIRIIPEIK